ncbi:MAG: hypothetical protein MK179_07745 [Pirellulaceae bacterium]|nr:hypothetical protein [Pirellulaceae bacterium]
MAKCDLQSNRNLFIAGFSLFMGLSVPAYFSAVSSPDAMAPGKLLAMYQPTADTLLASLPQSLARMIESVGSTGMAVAAIIGVVLDNVIPGTARERGLES